MSWIDEAEKLALAATPGPWKKGVAMPHVHGPDCCVAKCGDDHPMQDEWRASLPRWTADARHIANWSPDRVLKVLAVLRAVGKLSANGIVNLDLDDWDAMNSARDALEGEA